MTEPRIMVKYDVNYYDDVVGEEVQESLTYTLEEFFTAHPEYIPIFKAGEAVPTEITVEIESIDMFISIRPYIEE